MEILNSGSFVPLDNREKIDQLIYTARELASELGRTEGFQNSGQTNHQLGLEMWTGAEYVCRAHEEANIRNLFLSKFLERLREIEKETGFQTKTAATTTAPVATAPVRTPDPVPISVPQQPQPQPPITRTLPEQPLQNASQDEYLGVVDEDDQTENKRPSYADECVPEYDADIEALVDRLENEVPKPDADGSSRQIDTETAQPGIAATAGESTNETVTEPSVTTVQSASAEEVQSDAAESIESESISSIVLAEREPYNFDGCTVTAVVQLLPEAEGMRKCVVSIRTHDFSPRIAIVDVATVDALSQISLALGSVFEQYKNELPARAADKMKKEKPAPKKQSRAGSKAAKAATVQSKAATNSETTAAAPAPTPETDQSQQGLFAS